MLWKQLNKHPNQIWIMVIKTLNKVKSESWIQQMIMMRQKLFQMVLLLHHPNLMGISMWNRLNVQNMQKGLHMFLHQDQAAFPLQLTRGVLVPPPKPRARKDPPASSAAIDPQIGGAGDGEEAYGD